MEFGYLLTIIFFVIYIVFKVIESEKKHKKDLDEIKRSQEEHKVDSYHKIS